jgi:hypothetical protein
VRDCVFEVNWKLCVSFGEPVNKQKHNVLLRCIRLEKAIWKKYRIPAKAVRTLCGHNLSLARDVNKVMHSDGRKKEENNKHREEKQDKQGERERERERTGVFPVKQTGEDRDGELKAKMHCAYAVLSS